ncbi:hypothetical protein ABIA32_003293 [Streptacidiphilus sp. MAP12-20]|uniref:DUF2218 domain-containing protein n=1 Tax=Streptacidiphilus sp. MAP12-20 TaxID=3156299 RepID=UPI003516B8C8
MHTPRSHMAQILTHLAPLTARLRAARPRNPGPTAPPPPHGSAVRSTGRVATPKAERYAKQLCSHATWKTPHAQWTSPHGVIEFPDHMGTCRMTAQPDGLVFTIEAAGPAALARLQQIIGDNIARFGTREGLVVEWATD